MNDSIPVNSKDSVQIDLNRGARVTVENVAIQKEIDPLAPSRAAFFSAVLPGLGQVYNKRYWKVPLVYGALGTAVYSYSFNNTEYKRARRAFKRRLAGFTDDEFYDLDGNPDNGPDFSDSALEDAQERYQRDRDLALLITIGIYVLNIIDANVDAHLKQFNVDDRLGMDVKPYIDYNEVLGTPTYGIAMSINID